MKHREPKTPAHGVQQAVLDDVRIAEIRTLPAPSVLRQQWPVDEKTAAFVARCRATVADILRARDPRLLVVVGPCSIHDIDAAREYAERLTRIARELDEALFLVMRVYFEKPRTTIGWKGLLDDPLLDQSYDTVRGFQLARTLLSGLAQMGLPAGCEFLDTVKGQYTADLVSWAAIGARTTESQLHRELASGLSMPVGFKNSTDGNIRVALNAIRAAAHPHHFPSITQDGAPAIFRTTGNDTCHLILRGAEDESNYGRDAVEYAATELQGKGLPRSLMVDFSHGNSRQDYRRQGLVAESVASQLTGWPECPIRGVMIESNLVEGRQDCADPNNLVYGRSITDGCIGWEETQQILTRLAAAMASRK